MKYITTNSAGRLTIWLGNEWKGISFHFLPKKDYRLWGHEEFYYDGPRHQFGLGSFLLITWNWI